MKITNLKELEDRKELQFDDIVEFTIREKIVKYIVQYTYLLNGEHKGGAKNNEIFEVLEIDNEKLAKKAYGYKPECGIWPCCSSHSDFPALTRLVRELYIIIEGIVKYTKYSRFEIMEI